jgi:hypothetical protein
MQHHDEHQNGSTQQPTENTSFIGVLLCGAGGIGVFLLVMFIVKQWVSLGPPS